MTARRAPRAAARREQRVERAFAAVGQRQLDDVVEAGARAGPAAIAAAASSARSVPRNLSGQATATGHRRMMVDHVE